MVKVVFKIGVLIGLLLGGFWFYHRQQVKYDIKQYNEKIKEYMDYDQNFEVEKAKAWNPDIVGRVFIDGVIDEVVVQTENNIDYVHKDLDGNYNVYGTVFQDYRVDDKASNIILYGHSSKKKDLVFTSLMKYIDYEFIKAHPLIVYQDQEYELAYVFMINVHQEYDAMVFETHFEHEELFKKLLMNLSEYTMLDLNVDVSSVKEIITLVTCNPNNDEERLLVVGIKKS